jgi:hypothetical protein
METDQEMVTATGANDVMIAMRHAETRKRKRRRKRRRRSPSLPNLQSP